MTVLALDPTKLGKRKRRSVNWARLAVVGVAVYAGLLTARQLVVYAGLQAQSAGIDRRIAQLEAGDRELQQQAQALQTDAYVREVARNELGLVDPREVPFQPVPPGPK